MPWAQGLPVSAAGGRTGMAGMPFSESPRTARWAALVERINQAAQK